MTPQSIRWPENWTEPPSTEPRFKLYEPVDITIRNAQVVAVDDWNDTVTVLYGNEKTGEVFEVTVSTSATSVTVEGGEPQ